MIQLQILSGSKAGAQHVARRFPFKVGRAATNHLQVSEDGVWDEHATIEFLPGTGFQVRAAHGAITRVNAASVETTLLRNGDTIEMGALKLRFWLSESKQSKMQLREWATWAALTLISLGQIALIYWLSQE